MSLGLIWRAFLFVGLTCRIHGLVGFAVSELTRKFRPARRPRGVDAPTYNV
jgi:hypothetical protein